MSKNKGFFTGIVAAALACTVIAIPVSAATTVSSQQELDDFLSSWQRSIAEKNAPISRDEQIRRVTFSSGNRTVLDVGESFQLLVDTEPGDYGRGNEFLYTSSDPGVADVSGGLVTALAPGTAVITVRHRSTAAARDHITIQVRGERAGGASTSSQAPPVTAAGGALSRDALLAAVKASESGAATFSGYSFVGVDALQAAANAGATRVAFDTRDSAGSLLCRLTLNPASAAGLRADSSIRTAVHCGNSETRAVQLQMDGRYGNTLYVLKSEQDHYAMLVNLKVRVGKGVNPDTLHLYTYDEETGRVQGARLESATVDENGFAGFYTNQGGWLILSQGELR